MTFMINKFTNKFLPEIIMDSMPGLAYIFSKDGHLVAWNKRAEEILELSADEIKVKMAATFSQDSDTSKVKLAFEKCLLMGSISLEHTLLTKSGKKIPVLSVARVCEIDGEHYLIGLAVDITELVSERAKNFEYTNDEINIMTAQIQKLKSYRIDGFVFGAVTKNVHNHTILDIKAIYQICKAAFPFPVTIHKAIDQCFNILGEVEILKNISNVRYILSSGGELDAISGAQMLSKMQKASGKKINIIAAGKITPDNIQQIIAKTELKIYHGRKIV